MVAQVLRKKIEEVANKKGWKTTFSEQYDETVIEFENYTNVGQNLIVTIFINDDSSIQDVVNSIHKYWESFDTDYEASLWIGPDGHGKNGAPYHISDIIEDMKDAENMIEELFKEFQKNKDYD